MKFEGEICIRPARFWCECLFWGVFLIVCFSQCDPSQCPVVLWPAHSWEVLYWFVAQTLHFLLTKNRTRKSACVWSAKAKLRPLIEEFSLWGLRECFYTANAHRTLKMALSLCARCQLCIWWHKLLFFEMRFDLGKQRSFLFWKTRINVSIGLQPTANNLQPVANYLT